MEDSEREEYCLLKLKNGDKDYGNFNLVKQKVFKIMGFLNIICV